MHPFGVVWTFLPLAFLHCLKPPLIEMEGNWTSAKLHLQYVLLQILSLLMEGTGKTNNTFGYRDVYLPVVCAPLLKLWVRWGHRQFATANKTGGLICAKMDMKVGLFSRLVVVAACLSSGTLAAGTCCSVGEWPRPAACKSLQLSAMGQFYAAPHFWHYPVWSEV